MALLALQVLISFITRQSNNCVCLGSVKSTNVKDEPEYKEMSWNYLFCERDYQKCWRNSILNSDTYCINKTKSAAMLSPLQGYTEAQRRFELTANVSVQPWSLMVHRAVTVRICSTINFISLCIEIVKWHVKSGKFCIFLIFIGNAVVVTSKCETNLILTCNSLWNIFSHPYTVLFIFLTLFHFSFWQKKLKELCEPHHHPPFMWGHWTIAEWMTVFRLSRVCFALEIETVCIKDNIFFSWRE